MAAQPRPWFRLSSMVRPAPAGNPAPTPAPAPTPTPTPAPAPAPTPLVRPTLRPLAPPPAEPTPPPPAARAPTPSQPATRAPAPPQPAARAPASPQPAARVPASPQPAARAPTPPQPASPTPTPAQPAAAVAPPPPAATPPPPPPPAITSTAASVPTPARGINSAPSAALPPATANGNTSASSSVPASPGNKVGQSSTSGVPSPRNRVTTSVTNSPVTSKAVPSPPKPTFTANSVPQQTYSPPKPRNAPISSANTAREPSPNYNPSSRAIKPENNTPPQSPNRIKPTAPPPSPLNLPPSQLNSNTADQTDQRIPLEAEQKTVLVQKTIDQKPHSWFSTGGSKQDHDINRESHRPSIHAHHPKHEEKFNRKKLSSDSEEAPSMRVITIAGENKGAFMELIRSPNKHHQQGGEHSHYLYKKGNQGKPPQTVGNHESDHSYSSTSSGEEGNPKMKDKSHHRGNKAGNSSHLPLSSFTNSNVQGINNSIVYNTSFTHHDPGVHLNLSRKPNGDGFDVKSHVNGRHS